MVHARPRGDPRRVQECFLDGRTDLVVPAGQAVELLVRQEVVLEEGRGKVGVREARRNGNQRHERRAEVFDAVQVLAARAEVGGRPAASHGDVVFGGCRQV